MAGFVPRSRAVIGTCEMGLQECARCHQTLRLHERVVIANIYRRRRWVRVELIHLPCYSAAGDPYGPAEARRHTRKAAAFAISGHSYTKQCAQCAQPFETPHRLTRYCNSCRPDRNANGRRIGGGAA